MRLFVAVDISADVREHVRELQEQVPRETGSFSLTEPKQCHITLTFLGDVDEKQAEMVGEKLSSVEFDKFELTTSYLGFFPHDDYIRVFWLGTEESEQLQALAEDVRDSLPGFEDDHDFHSHVTLARVKDLYDKEGFKNAVEEMGVKVISWEVDSFKLMKSNLTPDGAEYSVIEEYTAS